jgi:hypothetical protein
MSVEEHATVGGSRDFPEEWGLPQGRPYSETRASWVRRMVDRHAALTAHRRLAAKDARFLAILRSALLDRRRDGP